MTKQTYNEFIQNIIDTRGRFIPSHNENIYKERHHIVPRCLGGTNDKDNLIDLLAEEHFIAHKLLAEENPTNKSLIYAWWNMCQMSRKDCQDRYIPTAKEYKEARITFVSALREDYKENGHPWLGKFHSNETKEKMRQAALGRKLTDECKTKISKSLKGKSIPGKSVLCVELNKVFPSAMEAERKTSTSHQNIISVCRNQRKTAGGYHWQYA